MSNPDYVGIEGETFTDDELEDNFQDYLDQEMPEFTFGNLSYSAGRVLREIDYTAFREEFNNWVDSEDHIDEWREDHPWLEEDEDEDEDYCYECEALTKWDDEVCTGCGRMWGHPSGE